MLYSCDFSNKSTSNTPILSLDDITSLGCGRRAEKAVKRLEGARKSLEDDANRQRALQAAIKLSKSIVKDCVVDTSCLAGSKRSRSSESSGSSRDDTSSVVSIPLAKARRPTPDTVVSEPDKSKEDGSFRPCLCKRSASSLIGNSGKGWEGAATVNHGSRLRFGCIQLVLSMKDKPGHRELVEALRATNII